MNLLDKTKFFVKIYGQDNANKEETIGECYKSATFELQKKAGRFGLNLERLGIKVSTSLETEEEDSGFDGLVITAFFVIDEESSYRKNKRGRVHTSLPASRVWHAKDVIEKELKSGGANRDLKASIMCSMMFLANEADGYNKQYEKLLEEIHTLSHELIEEYESMSHKLMWLECSNEDRVFEIECMQPFYRERNYLVKMMDDFKKKLDKIKEDYYDE